MKKLACIFAIALFSATMFSCTNDTAEDQTLYEQSTDGNLIMDYRKRWIENIIFSKATGVLGIIRLLFLSCILK